MNLTVHFSLWAFGKTPSAPFWKQIKVERERKKFSFFGGDSDRTLFSLWQIKVAQFVCGNAVLFPEARNHSASTLWLQCTHCSHFLLSARPDASTTVPFTPSPAAPSPLITLLLVFPASSVLLLLPPDPAGEHTQTVLPDAAARQGLSPLWLSRSLEG